MEARSVRASGHRNSNRRGFCLYQELAGPGTSWSRNLQTLTDIGPREMLSKDLASCPEQKVPSGGGTFGCVDAAPALAFICS